MSDISRRSSRDRRLPGHLSVYETDITHSQTSVESDDSITIEDDESSRSYTIDTDDEEGTFLSQSVTQESPVPSVHVNRSAIENGEPEAITDLKLSQKVNSIQGRLEKTKTEIRELKGPLSKAKEHNRELKDKISQYEDKMHSARMKIDSLFESNRIICNKLAKFYTDVKKKTMRVH